MALQNRLETLVAVFGGSGFLGRHVVRALAKRGYRVRVAVRRPELAGHLQPMGRVGQIHAVQANLRYPESVKAATRDADVVINLVGILFERGRQRFDAVMTAGAQTVAQSAKAVAAPLIHVSAIGADENSSAHYARAKAQAERLVLSAHDRAIIVRPSIIFGPEDDFFNRFAWLARLSPVLPLIGGGRMAFQPIYVGDVAEAAKRVLNDAGTAGKTYELGGPETMSFKAVMQLVLKETHRKRLLVPVPFAIARIQAAVLGLLPKPLLTLDQLRLLERDNVVSEGALTLKDIGIMPAAAEAIIPSYLWRFRKHGEFEPVAL